MAQAWSFCPCHTLPLLMIVWWSLAFLQSSTQPLVSKSILSGKHWKIITMTCAVYCQWRRSEIFQRNMIPTLKGWLIKIRTLWECVCFNRSSSKTQSGFQICLLGRFQSKACLVSHQLANQLLNSLPSSLLPSDIPVLGQPVEQNLSTGVSWASRLSWQN